MTLKAKADRVKGSIICAIRAAEEKKMNKEEKISKKKNKNFPEFMKNISLRFRVSKDSQAAGYIKKKKSIPRHITVSLQNTRNRDE